MKKIITLLIMFGSVATSYAQSPTIDKAKKVIKRDGGTTSYPNSKRTGDETSSRYPTSNSTNREAEINEINRRYDAKIQAVRANPILSAAEKERRIRDLDYERAQKIREVNSRYRGSNGGSNDGNYSKTKKNKGYKTNNGKHLGWEKGKGNPHRTGGSMNGKNKSKKGSDDDDRYDDRDDD